MTATEQGDDQIPKLDREVLEILANASDRQKLLSGGNLDNGRRLAFTSATGGYDQNSGELSGWITYGLFEKKIRFRTTKFTTRMLSFHGAGGFLTETLPLERLAGQTGTFSMSGNRELSLLWLWLGRDLACTPFFLAGQGGLGHLGEGEVRFWAVD